MRVRSTRFRVSQNGQATVAVRVSAIRSYRFDGERSPAKQQKIDRCAESDDAEAQRGLQRIMTGEQQKQNSHQGEKQQRRERIAPGAIRRVGGMAADAKQPGHGEADKEYRHEDEVGDD